LRGNTSVTLNLLCLGPERKIKCYNEYFINEHVFDIEEYDYSKNTYNNEVLLRDRLLMSSKFTIMKS
jgi:hypothetical protein